MHNRSSRLFATSYVAATTCNHGSSPQVFLHYACIAALAVLLLAFLRLPAMADEDEESRYRAGLVATYIAGGHSVARIDKTIAFDWQDAASDTRSAACEFAATWRGR